jgi:SPW repeat
MLIGVLIGFSPWLADQQGDQAVIWNAILVGAVVLVLAQLEYQLATLGGNRRDNSWAMADRVTIHLWLRRSWPAPVLAFRSRRNHCVACHLGALAGLEAK